MTPLKRNEIHPPSLPLPTPFLAPSTALPSPPLLPFLEPFSGLLKRSPFCNQLSYMLLFPYQQKGKPPLTSGNAQAYNLRIPVVLPAFPFSSLPSCAQVLQPGDTLQSLGLSDGATVWVPEFFLWSALSVFFFFFFCSLSSRPGPERCQGF